MTEAADNTTAKPKLGFHASRLFLSWLGQSRCSLAFTTYQAGKLFLIGLKPDGRLELFERSFERCMGLAASRDGLWMASLYQVWRFSNFLDQGQVQDGYDAVYVPVTGHTTGDIDVHDIHVGQDGRPVFVATRANCLATLSDTASLRPLWRPPFIDRFAVEDRCHLNGLAMRDGAPAYVTLVGQSNIADGWRSHRTSGGMVLSVPSGDVVAAGLSMPHSPRWHDGRLWILQAGTGEFGTIDLATGMFTPVCFVPGFARGLTFVGDHAVIGVSRPREDRTFSGLALNDRLEREGVQPKCALYIVNTRTGDIEHQLEIEGAVQELYDVAVIPGVIRPKVIGFRNNDIRLMIRPEI